MQKQEKQSATTAEQESYWLDIRQKLKTFVYPNVPEKELDYLIGFSRNLNLNPLFGETFLIPVGGKYVAYIANKGLRVLAVRTGEYEGQTQAFWCGEDGVWTDVWLSSTPPAAAKIGVYRKGFREALWHVAPYKNFVKKTNQGVPTQKWAEMPEDMLLMRAESGALKRAFPEHMPDTPDDDNPEADEIPNAGRFENAQRAAEAPKKTPQSTAFTTSTNVAEPQNYRGKLLQLIYKDIKHYQELQDLESTLKPERRSENYPIMAEFIADTQKLYDCVLNVDLPEADFKKTLDYFEQKGVNRQSLDRVLPPLQVKLSKQNPNSYRTQLFGLLSAELNNLAMDETAVEDSDIPFIKEMMELVDRLIERVKTVDLPEAAFEAESNYFKKYGVNKNTLNLALSRLIKK